MCRILLLLLSSILGVAVAAVASRFLQTREEIPQKADTREKAGKSRAIAGTDAKPLKTNAEKLPAPGESGLGQAEKITVRGYIVRGGYVNVVLSDGRTVTEKEALTSVMRNSVTLEGEKLYLQQARDRPPVQVPSVLPSAPNAKETAATGQPVDAVDSSWRTDADGVQRLTKKEELAKSSMTLR